MRVFNQQGDAINIRVGGSDADDIQVISAEFDARPGESVPDGDIDWIAHHHADAIYLEWVEERITASICDLYGHIEY